MSSINSDLLDDGLQAVMGKDRCQSDWQPKKEQKKVSTLEDKPKATITEPVDAQFMKLNTVSPMAKLKGCVKGVWLYGGISLVLFWWQQAGLLDPRAAVPSFIVLALLAGVQIGRICRE